MSSAEGVIPLCSLDDIGEGRIGSAVLPDGRRVAVYLVDGRAHATDDRCTHGESSLADEGWLDGHVVECGRHMGTFDVRTGQPLGPPCTKALRTYPVEIHAGQVMLARSALPGGGET